MLGRSATRNGLEVAHGSSCSSSALSTWRGCTSPTSSTASLPASLVAMLGGIAALTMWSTGRYGNITLADTELRVGQPASSSTRSSPYGVSRSRTSRSRARCTAALRRSTGRWRPRPSVRRRVRGERRRSRPMPRAADRDLTTTAPPGPGASHASVTGSASSRDTARRRRRPGPSEAAVGNPFPDDRTPAVTLELLRAVSGDDVDGSTPWRVDMADVRRRRWPRSTRTCDPSIAASRPIGPPMDAASGAGPGHAAPVDAAPRGRAHRTSGGAAEAGAAPDTVNDDGVTPLSRR